MDKVMDFFEQPYAGDDALLNEYIERILYRVSVELFYHQEDIVYMANETDNGLPQMREGAIDEITRVVRQKLGWLTSYMVDRILIAYMKGNITPSEEVKWHFEDMFDEEDCAQFWNEIDDYIWEDYNRFLGEERLTKLWEKWGKAPRGDE